MEQSSFKRNTLRQKSRDYLIKIPNKSEFACLIGIPIETLNHLIGTETKYDGPWKKLKFKSRNMFISLDHFFKNQDKLASEENGKIFSNKAT